MKNKPKYTDAPPGVDEAIAAGHQLNQEEIAELLGLPTPDQIANRLQKAKVTLQLNSESVERFKKKAKELGVSYQVMIREVVDDYAQMFL